MSRPSASHKPCAPRRHPCCLCRKRRHSLSRRPARVAPSRTLIYVHAMFTYTFLEHAILASLITAVVAPTIGFFLVLPCYRAPQNKTRRQRVGACAVSLRLARGSYYSFLARQQRREQSNLVPFWESAHRHNF